MKKEDADSFSTTFWTLDYPEHNCTHIYCCVVFVVQDVSSLKLKLWTAESQMLENFVFFYKYDFVWLNIHNFARKKYIDRKREELILKLT